jgi:GNAT superfamily N-acetyltransferase
METVSSNISREDSRRENEKSHLLKVTLATTDEDIEKCFLVLQALRPHLQKDMYLQRIRSQQAQGYQLAFVGNESLAFSAIGFRMMEMLYCGRFIYIDDVSTLPEHRGKGYAGQLLDWVVELAKENNIGQIHLDSGHQRHTAHRLYLNKKFNIISHHFMREVL